MAYRLTKVHFVSCHLVKNYSTNYEIKNNVGLFTPEQWTK